MPVLGFTTDYYLRVSTLGLVMLAVLCIAGLIGVGFICHRLLHDRFGEIGSNSLTWPRIGALALILTAIVVALALNVEQESPSQTAKQISAESSSGIGNPFLESGEDNPFLK